MAAMQPTCVLKEASKPRERGLEGTLTRSCAKSKSTRLTKVDGFRRIRQILGTSHLAVDFCRLFGGCSAQVELEKCLGLLGFVQVWGTFQGFGCNCCMAENMGTTKNDCLGSPPVNPAHSWCSLPPAHPCGKTTLIDAPSITETCSPLFWQHFMHVGAQDNQQSSMEGTTRTTSQTCLKLKLLDSKCLDHKHNCKLREQ